jgi:hypothetical protein
MRAGAILEAAAFRLRRRWRVALLLALAFAGPGALFTAAAGVRFNAVVLDIFPSLGGGLVADVPLLTASQVERLGGAFLAYLAATLVAGVLGSVGAVAFSVAVLDREQRWGEALGAAVRVALGRTVSVLAFMLVTSAVVVGLLLAGLLAMTSAITSFSSGPISRGGPGVFLALVVGVATVVAMACLTMRWAPAYPVMAMEGAGWRGALRRSWQLSAGNAWRVAFVVILGALLTALGAAVISQLLAVVLVDLLAGAVGLDAAVAETLVAAIGSVLLAPLSPALLAVLYLDLRARHDLSVGTRPPDSAGMEPRV